MPNSGQRISEYVLDAKLGAGAFGEVWRARHHVWGNQFVAIKLPTDSDYLRGLQREGLTIQGLDHPNVVKAIGFDPFASPPYLVMEYVAGRSLREIIAGGPVSPDVAVKILNQVLAGLRYAHGMGIIHRDVKPENILIREGDDGFPANGSVKIADFGLGQTRASAAASIALSMSIESDKAAKIAGTLDYMSPEQRAGATLDARSDLYACGVILFELLTGEKPTGTELPGDVRPGMPAGLNEVFKKSYTRLDRRYASAEAMATALVAVALRADHRPAPVAPPIPRGKKNKSADVMTRSAGIDAAVTNRPLGEDAPNCPRCRRGVGAGDQFCIHCGVQMVSVVRRCDRCGGFPDPADKFCIHCGETLAPRLALA